MFATYEAGKVRRDFDTEGLTDKGQKGAIRRSMWMVWLLA